MALLDPRWRASHPRPPSRPREVPCLTQAASGPAAAALAGAQFDAAVSSNRTCEIALGRATGLPYRSVVHLLDEGTR